MKKLLLTVLSMATVACMAFGAAACDVGDGGSSSSSSSTSSSSSSSTSSSTSSSSSSGGGASQNEAPVIQVEAGTETIEWHAGEMSQQEAVETLGMGITVIDEDSDLEATIIDLDGFDINVEGTYTITYYVEDSAGLSATATRTVNVLEALPGIVLEAQEDKHVNDETDNKQLLFANNEYKVLTATTETTYDPMSGVFYNSTSEELTITVGGGYGCAAIVNANGLVVEGRDGTNGKLVNAANPIRGASTATCTSASFAADMVIPAGGFAIVVQQNRFGTGANFDGRNFMNYSVIANYGTPIRLFMQDAPTEYLTTYVDQGPVIKGNGAVTVLTTDTLDDAKAKALVGFTYADDNGTFEVADDVKTGLTATVLDVGEYVAGTEGTYTFTLQITDGTNATEFTRTVNVVASNWTLSYVGKVSGSTKSLTVAANNTLVLGAGDTCPSSVSRELVIFTPEYTGTLNFDWSHGAAVIVDKYGKIKAIYDGANGGIIYTGATFGEKTTGQATAETFDTKAFADWNRAEGEYLIFGRNEGNGQPNEERGYILGMRWDVNTETTASTAIGQKLSIVGLNTDKTITFEEESATQD